MTALTVTAAQVMSWLVETGERDLPWDGEGEFWDLPAFNILHQAIQAIAGGIRRGVLACWSAQHVPLCACATVSRKIYPTMLCSRRHLCPPQKQQQAVLTRCVLRRAVLRCHMQRWWATC
jgi:hypothetical protein